MRRPRQQGRWPACVLVALLLVLTAFALQMRQRFPGLFSPQDSMQASSTLISQHPWEVEIPGGSGDATAGALVLEVDHRTPGNQEPGGSQEDFNSQRAEARPPVATRVEPLSAPPLPVPEETGPTESAAPPSLADEWPAEQSVEDRAATPAGKTGDEAAYPWPSPRSLIEQLQQLSQDSAIETWSRDVLSALGRLQVAPSLESPEAAEVLAELNDLVQQADRQISVVSHAEPPSQWRRVRYGLMRRLEVWEQAHQIAQEGGTSPPATEPDKLAEKVAAVQTHLAVEGQAEGWSEYLLLSELAALAADGQPEDEACRLAQRALRRMHSRDLSDQQRELLALPPFDALELELRGWAAEPVDLPELLAAVENYEENATEEYAAALARLCRTCAQWPREEVIELGRRIDVHWRNANVRVSASEEFLNLFIPQMDPTHEWVSDRILGARVRGQSASSTELYVRLYSDPSRIRIGLAAEGIVESRTRSYKGPITIHSDGHGTYHAEKLIVFEPTGASVWGAEGEADCRSCLRGIDSSFNNVPLFGNMVRNIARNEHDELRGVVRWEFERRVAGRAEQRFDEVVNQQVAEADEQLHTRVLQPLKELELDPVAIDMQTTEERAIVRFRLADQDQLSAHTPRPVPPEESLLNVQIHQSAINNAVGQLGLNGRRCDLRDLYAELATRLGDTSGEIPDDIPDRVTLELAPTQSVRIVCEDGRAMLELHVIELSRRRNSWHNFTVRAYYEPVLDGLRADMARISSIELEGEGLRLRDQVALRGIFTKVLSRNQRLQMVPDELLERSSMIGVKVTQFRIEDGWVGISLGYPHGQRPIVADVSDNTTR